MACFETLKRVGSGTLFGLVALSISACQETSEADEAPVAVSSEVGAFLALTDVHLRAGAEFNCSGCETTEPLWRSARAKAADILQKEGADFIIYLGDMPAHGQKVAPRENDFREVLDGLAELVDGTNVPLLYLPGNNDTVGPNYCGFDWKGTKVFEFSDEPTKWPVINASTGPGSRAEVLDDRYVDVGFYSARVTIGEGAAAQSLRVLALNTVVFTSGSDKSECDQDKSLEEIELALSRGASTQLDWMRDQLNEAEKKSEPVIVAMHVPPGVDGFGGGTMWGRHLDYYGDEKSERGRWLQDVFLERITEKSEVIVGLFAGHTHLNGIRRLYSCDGDYKELLLSVPAVSTDHGNNPSMKRVSLGGGLEPIEAETYYADDEPSFPWAPGKSFSFHDNYPSSKAPVGADLFDVIDQVPSNETLFEDMLANLYTGAKSDPSPRDYDRAMDVKCGR